MLSPTVMVQEILGQVMHHLRRSIRAEQADGRAVAEEAQVAIVRHDMDRRATPCGLVGGGLAWPGIVYGTDVAAVEADAGSVAEHVAPGWVGWGGSEGECCEELFGAALLGELAGADDDGCDDAVLVLYRSLLPHLIVVV